MVDGAVCVGRTRQASARLATAGAIFALAIGTPLLSGCVSSATNSTASSFQPTSFQSTGEVASVEFDGVDRLVPGSREAAQDDADVAVVAVATVIPQKAPRDGNGNPLLLDGARMAIVYAPPVLDETVAYAPASEDSVARNTFEALLAAQKEAAGRGGGNVAALPGVKLRQDLIPTEDGEDESGLDGVQVASATGFGRLSPLGLRLQRDSVDVHCFPPELLAILASVEQHFGSKPIITSGFRSAGQNRRAGGATHSMHVECKAADIQVEGVSKWTLAKYLQDVPGRGGIGTYCRTESVHIDVGEAREWYYPCRRVDRRRPSA